MCSDSSNGATPEVPGYGEYEIDIEAVLRDRLPGYFDTLNAVPLTSENVRKIPMGAKGAYMLFKGNSTIPVYVGKTDAEHGFRDRLDRHAFTVQGRHNLDPNEMCFKAVRILVFSALDVEAILIKTMKEHHPTSISWNNSGFGSNDPGKRRDGQEPARFDKLFPIDFDYIINGLPVGLSPLRDVLTSAKAKLPYLFRFDDIPIDLNINAVPSSCSFRDLINRTMLVLNSGWQCTVLHGRVIMYPRHEDYEWKQEVLRN